LAYPVLAEASWGALVVVSHSGELVNYVGSVGLGDDGSLRAVWAVGTPRQLRLASVTDRGGVGPRATFAVLPAGERVAALTSEPLSAGRTLVVWQTGATIRLATLAANGRRLRSYSFPGYAGDVASAEVGASVTGLRNGGALLCWTSRAGGRFSVHTGVVSAAGALRVVATTVANPGPFLAVQAPGWCGVAASRRNAVIAWVAENQQVHVGEAPPHVFLQRFVAGGGLSQPILLNANIASPFVPSSMTVSPTGAVAMSWVAGGPGGGISAEPEMLWITAGNDVGQAISLEPLHSGHRRVTLEAVGANRVVALIGAYDWLLAEEVDATGQVSARSRVYGDAIDFESASNGSKIVVAWQSQSAGAPFATEWARGRLHALSQLGPCDKQGDCAQLGGVAMNKQGEASSLLDLPGTNPSGAGIAATFHS